VILPQDHYWMEAAIKLSRQCPPSLSAYSVGATIVDADGEEVSRGYSRETDIHVHAEESAMAKLALNDPRLARSTLYSTLEPCSQRRSRSLTCTDLTLQALIPRVVIAWREPELFVPNAIGVEKLQAAGIDVVELRDMADDARAVNAHLFK
jgi:diaminohydroxyphosphoribosylaminopyrimidine deaminase/5-amino-6-(5-phosphoribosylamino)uracil reductase